MKYKNIHSLIHNFAHSFFSFENQGASGAIAEKLEPLAKYQELVLRFIPVIDIDSSEFKRDLRAGLSYPEEVLASMRRYQQWLPELAEKHGVDLSCILSLSVKSRPDRKGVPEVIVEATDDRGVLHSAAV